MKREIYISLLILISYSMSIVAQHDPFCGSDEYEQILLQNIEYQSQAQQEEKAYRARALRPKIQKRNSEVTIPVVFHIIHNNGPENISDAQVLQGLEHLNQAFANEGSYQNDEGLDTKIRFCLAQRDDKGNEINGIYRYESPYTDMSIFDGFEYVKSRKIDSTSYINIQIVKNACLGSDCSTAGFAGEYRIVVAANTIDNTPSKASVLVHEMGHYLGLKHTWHGGCKNDDCLKDGDKVCDTPPDNRTYDGCTTPSNSCFTDEDDTSNNNPYRPLSLGGLGDQPDDKTNFMDYNIRSCRNKFTQGQADRMFFFIENKYAGLLNSKGCLPPCETFLTAEFDLPDSIAVGSGLTIQNQSTNADNYQWYIDGSPESIEEDMVYTFIEEGLINVQLEAYTNDTLCESDIITKTIRVYCPTEACFDYTINGQYLILDDCSTNATTLELIVINDKDTIYTTAESLDSVYVNNIDFVKVCLTARGEHCSDVHCEYITMTTDGSEICGNEQDDDGDGLIDLFDPDCPCQDDAYQAQCPPVCEIVPDSFPDIKVKMKWESEKISGLRISTSSFSIGNVNQNDGVSIISPFHQGGIGSSKNYIATFRADNGLMKDTFRILPDYSFFELATYTAVAKDNFSDQYFIYGLARDTLICINQSGVEIFKKGYDFKGRTIGVADFNGDGFFEVYIGRIIINGQTGEVLIDESNSCDDFCYRNISIAADVLGDDGLPELISGQYVFDVNIINTNYSLGNSVVVTQAPLGVSDGKCAVADVNGNGQLEVIVVQSNIGNTSFIGNLSVWNPRNQMLLAQIPNPILGTNNWDGSIPFVGDVDGDCIPEIGVVYNLKFTLYKYINNNLEELYSVGTSDRSGITGITMFDFQQDGRQELIYRDETHLRIFDGATGKTIDSTQMFSGTLWEYPIVADIDNDGQAEIIVSGSRTSQDEVRMYCFESATTPWAPARSVWNQYAYNPTQVNDDLTIPRYQQNAAQPLQGTENCPRETCNTPYNNFMVQATYRTQEGCYVWPELQRDLSISAESRCIGDSIELCFYVSSTDSAIINEGVTINCYPPSWDDTDGAIIQSIDEIVVTTDTTCIIMPMLDIDSLLIVVNDDEGFYPSEFPITDIEECDYTNNEFILQLGGPDFSIDIIDWECSPDSLIFYIATDNVGLDTDVSCIGGGCYFTDPSIGSVNGVVVTPVEYTNWCFDFDTTTMSYQYQDTFRVAIPHPIGQSHMWWTINEGGFGPGVLSSEVTGMYECDYTNNTDSISFDISERVLDLGPDIIKCSTEVFTLNAGSGFESYLWNDLTTDSIYSAIEEGIHYVETKDQCGRVDRDTITVTIDGSEDIDLGDDMILCYDQDTVLTIIGDYDEVFWDPSEIVDCDTCMSTLINVDTVTTLFVQARKGNCMSYDTIMIERMLPTLDTVTMTSCIGDTIDFFGQSIIVDGIYERLSSDCSRLDVLEAIFTAPDTTHRIEQICSSDSILFNGQYLNTQGIYEMTAQNILGCDSTIILDLEVVEELSNTDTLHICENDSIQVFGEWISIDTTAVQSFISSAGCDSTQTILVISNLLPTNDVQVHVCEGDSVLLYGAWYKSDGYYDAFVANVDGCDSLISLEIITKENFATYDTIIACQGDTIQVFEATLTNSDDVSELYFASNGCDSISYYHVEFVGKLESSEELMLCPGDSILINSEWIKTEGAFETMHSSHIGCDSVHTVYLSLVSDPPNPETEVDCEELEIIVSIEAQSEWNPVWNNGDTTSQTTYPSGMMEANLLLYSPLNCEKQFTINLPQLPDINGIPTISDTTIRENQTVFVKLGLDPNEWTVLWNDASIVDCDTCMSVEISPTENTEITIYLEHESGCTFESSFLINLEEEIEGIYVPNIFSPNNDNNNDSWSVFSTSNIQITACNVYDRWGNLVYNIKGDLPEWDGKFKGNIVEQGVYVYMIRYIDSKGEQQVKFGDITLLR